MLLLLTPILFLTGCVQTDTRIIYDGLIGQLIKITTPVGTLEGVNLTELRTELMENSILGLHEERFRSGIFDENRQRVNFMYGKYVGLGRNGDTLQLLLEFDNRESFIQFNQILRLPIRETAVEIVSSPFFLERTLTIPNPIVPSLLETNSLRTQRIIDHLTQEFGGTADVSFIYVFGSSFRRSDSNSPVAVERRGDAWFHIFPVYEPQDLGDIIIFDRFANTPIWYGIGIAATVLFMAGIWFALRSRHPAPDQNSALQN